MKRPGFDELSLKLFHSTIDVAVRCIKPIAIMMRRQLMVEEPTATRKLAAGLDSSLQEKSPADFSAGPRSTHRSDRRLWATRTRPIRRRSPKATLGRTVCRQ